MFNRVFVFLLSLFISTVSFSETTYHILINYNLPISVPRMFVIDSTGVILHSGRVSHGEGSGNGLIPTHFSNRFNSHASSDGKMIVAEEYRGKHGLAFRIKGLEKKNSNVYARKIEIHSAEYMDGKESGLTWGCFGVSRKDMDWYLKHIKPGTIIEVIP